MRCEQQSTKVFLYGFNFLRFSVVMSPAEVAAEKCVCDVRLF